MNAGTAARGSDGKRTRSGTEINQNIPGGHSEQVEDVVALRLDVAEISMSAIVNFDLHRIALVSSHLLKLVVLPGWQISHSSIDSCRISRTREHEAPRLSASPDP